MCKINFDKESLNIIIQELINGGTNESISELLQIEEDNLKSKASESHDSENLSVVKDKDVLVIFAKKIFKLYYLRCLDKVAWSHHPRIVSNIRLEDIKSWVYNTQPHNSINDISSLTDLEIIDGHVHGKFIYM